MGCRGLSQGLAGLDATEINGVAVKELSSSYYIGETILSILSIRINIPLW